MLLIKMVSQNYKCFEEAIEKAKEARSLVDYVVQGNELEALLYLSPSDYIKCLTGYSGVLDKIESLIKERKLSVEDLNLHLKRLYNASDIITPLSPLLADLNVDDFNYDGDKETGFMYLRTLTNDCSKRTNELAEKVEKIVKRGYDEIPKRKDIYQELNKFILYCQDVRRKNAHLDDKEYSKFVRWKDQIEKLATNKNGNEKLSDLISKALIEMGLVFNMYESKSKFAGQMFDLKSRELKSNKSEKGDKKPEIDMKRVEKYMEEL